MTINIVTNGQQFQYAVLEKVTITIAEGYLLLLLENKIIHVPVEPIRLYISED